MTNPSNTTLYIGVTNNLTRRMAEHRSESIKGFSSKYHLKHLLYFEEANDVNSAIAREKQLKNCLRFTFKKVGGFGKFYLAAGHYIIDIWKMDLRGMKQKNLLLKR